MISTDQLQLLLYMKLKLNFVKFLKTGSSQKPN